MKKKRDLIVTAMLSPESVLELTMPEWDLLIRQGRRANLLATLAQRLLDRRLIDVIPSEPRHHLNASLLMAERQNVTLRWEISCIREALADVDTHPVLLKGAAYAMAGLRVSMGRMFSDIDILVPKAKLEHAEVKLQINGWQNTHHDEYDQRYYRQWMHEIPPMRHLTRGTTIDVHHTILPETARIKVNTPALFEGVISWDEGKGLYMLSPTDMLLHSATHLFHEGDFEKGLRDLFDLDSLIREFGKSPEFWLRLVPRAIELRLTRPLFYALRYTRLMLDTPIPDHVQAAANVGRPIAPVLWLMDACYQLALRPVHASTHATGTRPARFLLYIRSHWLRMPLHLLIYHLGRKAFMQGESAKAEKQIADAQKQAQDHH